MVPWVLQIGKNQRKINVENLGTKGKKLWNLKRKGVGKEIFEKKEEEFEGEWNRLEFRRGRIGENRDGELG